jgi:serine/threonine protein kinase
VQYEILKKLGMGSYGKVKKCRDIVTGKTYAMKIFSRMKLRKPRMNAERTTAFDDVMREVKIMSSCNHPNIVSLVEVMNDPSCDHLYLILEYCSNGPLMKKNMEEYHFDSFCVKQFARDIFEGVAYLHAHHIVHRDLKPENLLLTSKLVVKLGDFGVAEEFQGENDVLKRSAGTPSFTSPEQISANCAPSRGRQADMWALGVTLYCLAFSKVPFPGVTVMEVYDRVREGLVEYPDGCEPSLKDLLSQLMKRDPEKRIDAVAALAHEYFKGTIKRTGTE